MPYVQQFTDIPDVLTSGVQDYPFLVDLFVASSNSQRRFLDVRLTVDAVEIPIADYTYEADDNEIGDKLTVSLARLSDYSAFTRDASIKFEQGEKIAGVWTWVTRFDDARLLQTSRTLANKETVPNDRITIVAQPLLAQRLDKTPLATVALYDPAKLTLSDNDFITIPDIDGVEHLVTLVSTADLSLYSLLDYLMPILGFAGYQTNIPDFEIRRVDFNPAEPYWNAVAGIIGMFKPQLDIDPDDNLIIRDGTADVLPDSSAAVNLAVDRLTQMGDSRDIERYKGVFLTYQEQGLGWDYWQFDIVNDDHYRNDIAGQWPLTRRETWVQKFYRKAFPDTPVKELRRIERKWVDFVSENVAASSETLNYTSLGLLSGREKRVHAKVKAPASWITFQSALPGPGTISIFDGGESSYTSATDATFTNALVLKRTEQETIVYKAHPYEQDQVYMAWRENQVKGLITRDSDNPQLDQDFDQPIETAQRSGNLATGQGSYWGTTGQNWEQQIPTRNRGVIIRSSDADQLNTDDGEALLPNDYEDPRQGDIGISVTQHIQKQMYVFDEADSTATKILPLNGGEAPISILKPLAIRYNRAQFYPGNASMNIPGFDFSLTRGRTVYPTDRAGTTFGTYRITGFTISGSGGKHSTVLRGHQIKDNATPIVSDAILDVQGIALESEAQRIITIRVACWSGQELYSLFGAVSDLTVEARHGHSGTWTDIETSSIDLSTWDGLVEDFEVRLTAPVVTSHYVRSFVLRAGPAVDASEPMTYLGDSMEYLGDSMTY